MDLSSRPARSREPVVRGPGPEVKVSSVLASSGKVLKTKIERTDDIIRFSDSISRLEMSIEDVYGDLDEKLKIQICLNQLDESLRTEGDQIFEQCKLDGFFCLEHFLREIFAVSFPAPLSTLNSAFECMVQEKGGSIAEYSRKFRGMINMLKYDLEGYKSKWVDGLENREVRAALRRQNWERMSFREIVSLAVAIDSNLKRERSVAKVYQLKGTGGGVEGVGREEVGERGWGEEDDEHAYAIMGVPVKRYFDAADKKKVQGRCFNCFGSHRSTLCPVRVCKFCQKKTGLAQHYSLLCPKAPESLDKYFEQRREAKVKLVSEPEEYEFQMEEFSELE